VALPHPPTYLEKLGFFCMTMKPPGNVLLHTSGNFAVLSGTEYLTEHLHYEVALVLTFFLRFSSYILIHLFTRKNTAD
jgi:hypothetical protein